MRASWRTHVMLVVLTLAATFGLGQTWSLYSSLREGSASTSLMILGILGALVLLASGVTLSRLFYKLSKNPNP